MTSTADLSSASIGQLFIPVANLEQATAFYRDTLGIPFLFTAPPQMSFFQAGNVRLLVGVPEGNAASPRSSMIYFRVADIQSVHAGLSAKGVAFGTAPHAVHRAPTYELWLADFADPDGNPLALMCEVPVAT